MKLQHLMGRQAKGKPPFPRNPVLLDGHAHDWSAEFDRRAWRWLDRVWGTTAGKEPNR